MSDNLVVKLENISKYYKLYGSPKDRLKEALNPFGKKYHKEFYALKNISFELYKGECLGVIGKNGMGKSTLLKIIAHVIPPSSGNIFVNGSVSALLELGTGFNPEFTGRQNIYFYGTILGFSRNQIDEKVKEIIEFADIGEFIDQPVKTYSSGMFIRLAFSVQTSLEPDILIIDEVLSVGDIFFQQKCHARIEELLKRGTSLILVSHDMLAIQKYATRTALVDKGEIIFCGDSIDAIHRYYQSDYAILDNELTESTDKAGGTGKINLESNPNSKMLGWPGSNEFLDISQITRGNSICELQRIAICGDNSKRKSLFEIGETVNFFYEVLFNKSIEIPVGAISLVNSANIIIHAKDTLQYHRKPDWGSHNINQGDVVRFKQTFKLDLSIGVYTFSLLIGQISFDVYNKVDSLDYIEREKLFRGIIGFPNIGYFEVKEGTKGNKFPFHGLVDIQGDYEINVL